MRACCKEETGGHTIVHTGYAISWPPTSWGEVISQHLITLEEKLALNFPSASTEAFEESTTTRSLSLHMQEQLSEMKEDRTMTMLFNDSPLDSGAKGYPIIAYRVVAILLPFSRTYSAFQAICSSEAKKRQIESRG